MPNSESETNNTCSRRKIQYTYIIKLECTLLVRFLFRQETLKIENQLEKNQIEMSVGRWYKNDE